MGVMQTALSAMSAYEFMLSVTANNLANLNTPGFKSQAVSFQDSFYQTLRGSTFPSEGEGGLNPIQVGTGVVAGSLTTRLTQGIFTPTAVPTDLSVMGRGFFALQRNVSQSSGASLFTRDGSFRMDAEGKLVHAGTGTILLGWLADETGNINSGADPVPLILPTESLTTMPTTTVRFGGNLDARLSVGDVVPISFSVFDSQGNTHTIQLTFTKTATNTWDWQAQMGGNSVGSGTVQFDEGGNWQSGTGTLTLTLTNGAQSPQAINLDLQRLTQVAADTTVGAVFQDGLAPANLESISVDSRGVISGIFSNGVVRPLAQVAIAVFPNPEGLQRVGDNLFTVSGNSGLPRFLPPSIGGIGSIQAGGIEASNVELARELAQVLVAQRSFQAAARLVLAADDLIQEALNLRR